MMPRGFKPVGWVAAIGGAALSCYMLSLNVAAERAEVAKLERQILLARQDIRALQTELGTRGRLSQLEHWNAEVLALSAPTNAQFLDDAVTLARFDRRERTVEEKVRVQMASADTGATAPRAAAPSDAMPERKLPPAQYAVAVARAAPQPSTLVRQASYTPGEARIVRAVAKVESKADVKPAAQKTAAKGEAKPAAKIAARSEPKPSAPAKATKAGSSLKAVVAGLSEDRTSSGATGAAFR